MRIVVTSDVETINGQQVGGILIGGTIVLRVRFATVNPTLTAVDRAQIIAGRLQTLVDAGMGPEHVTAGRLNNEAVVLGSGSLIMTADALHAVANNSNADALATLWASQIADAIRAATVGDSQMIGWLWNGVFDALAVMAPPGPILPSPVPQAGVALDFDWGTGGPPGVGPDNFSARWKGRFTFAPGAYIFTAGSDDGIKVWLDGALVCNHWVDRSYTEDEVPVTLTVQSDVTIQVDYYERAGFARVNFRWRPVPPPVTSLTIQPASATVTVGDPSVQFKALDQNGKEVQAAWSANVGKIDAQTGLYTVPNAPVQDVVTATV